MNTLQRKRLAYALPIALVLAAGALIARPAGKPAHVYRLEGKIIIPPPPQVFVSSSGTVGMESQ